MADFDAFPETPKRYQLRTRSRTAAFGETCEPSPKSPRTEKQKTARGSSKSGSSSSSFASISPVSPCSHGANLLNELELDSPSADASSPGNVILQKGRPAPKFAAPTTSNGFADLVTCKGQTVVLFAYPKAMTPGCTQEAKDFAALHSHFVNANAVVYGISKDTEAAQEKFKAKEKLPYELICDPEGKVCNSYGFIQQKKSFGRTVVGIVRSTVVIDGCGNVFRVWSKVSPKGHAAEVLNVVQSLALVKDRK